MVLKELILTVSTFGGYGGSESRVSTLWDVEVLKEQISKSF